MKKIGFEDLFGRHEAQYVSDRFPSETLFFKNKCSIVVQQLLTPLKKLELLIEMLLSLERTVLPCPTYIMLLFIKQSVLLYCYVKRYETVIGAIQRSDNELICLRIV